MKGLRALEAEMSRNYDDLTRRFHEHAYRRTFRGRVAAVVGRLFAVYCVVRVVSVSVTCIHHQTEVHYLSHSNAGENPLVQIGLLHYCRIRKLSLRASPANTLGTRLRTSSNLIVRGSRSLTNISRSLPSTSSFQATLGTTRRHQTYLPTSSRTRFPSFRGRR